MCIWCNFHNFSNIAGYFKGLNERGKNHFRLFNLWSFQRYPTEIEKIFDSCTRNTVNRRFFGHINRKLVQFAATSPRQIQYFPRRKVNLKGGPPTYYFGKFFTTECKICALKLSSQSKDSPVIKIFVGIEPRISTSRLFLHPFSHRAILNSQQNMHFRSFS